MEDLQRCNNVCRDIGELWGFANAPSSILEVFRAAFMILDDAMISSWRELLRKIANPRDFIQKLMSFNPGDETESARENILSILDKECFKYDWMVGRN